MKDQAVLTTGQTKSRLRRIFPVILLFFLAPIFGEYILGVLSLSELPYVIFLAPMYGGGALLIREITRRTDGGLATMLILGIAYGLIEEGIIDQMIFNPNYLTQSGFEWHTAIPFIGVDAWLTIYVLAMHAIWSTCIPILIVEALFPERGNKPWLGKSGIGVVSAVFILGSAFLCYDVSVEKQFFASIPQLVGTIIIIVLLVIISIRFGNKTLAPTKGDVPKPLLLGLFSFITSSLFMLADTTYGWASVWACLLLLTGFFLVVYYWSQRHGWGRRHQLALAGGGILTYSWLGLFSGSIIFGSGAIILFVLAYRRIKKYETGLQSSLK